MVILVAWDANMVTMNATSQNDCDIFRKYLEFRWSISEASWRRRCTAVPIWPAFCPTFPRCTLRGPEWGTWGFPWVDSADSRPEGCLCLCIPARWCCTVGPGWRTPSGACGVDRSCMRVRPPASNRQLAYLKWNTRLSVVRWSHLHSCLAAVSRCSIPRSGCCCSVAR